MPKKAVSHATTEYAMSPVPPPVGALDPDLLSSEADPDSNHDNFILPVAYERPLPRLLIKKLAHYGDLPNPTFATEGSSACDLMAAIDGNSLWMATIGDRLIVPTGLALEIPPGWEAQIRPRSGLAAKFGVTVLNTPGTIDCDYRGEVKIILVNTSNRRFEVTRGMRIAQLVMAPVYRLPMEFSDELSQTKRGAGGFGSTGTH